MTLGESELSKRLYAITNQRYDDNCFPQQTMTLGESELSKRLYAITNQRYDDNCFPVIISIDFKSWNLHWSQMSTVFKDNQTDHEIPPGEPFLWTNHKGGFEGLRQKGWTLITICLLLYVEFQTGIKSVIIGQGDNQVVKILLLLKEVGLTRDIYLIKYKDHILSEITKFQNVLDKASRALGLEFQSVLDKASRALGLEVKMEETFYSTDVLIYGKDILYKGAYLSSATKKISRMLADINDMERTFFTKGLIYHQQPKRSLECWLILTKLYQQFMMKSLLFNPLGWLLHKKGTLL
ncbi:Mononegavirales RNA dependent RNA polymerase [Popillia japonica]|uniref:Mononegavirales RNA dependent RNA polymerase n=1 Tax=Popillia japonica TaxID=7064 RepID=A0AAW1LJA1_POPJA